MEHVRCADQLPERYAEPRGAAAYQPSYALRVGGPRYERMPAADIPLTELMLPGAFWGIAGIPETIYKASNRVEPRCSAPRLSWIEDGLSNTALIAEQAALPEI